MQKAIGPAHAVLARNRSGASRSRFMDHLSIGATPAQYPPKSRALQLRGDAQGGLALALGQPGGGRGRFAGNFRVGARLICFSSSPHRRIARACIRSAVDQHAAKSRGQSHSVAPRVLVFFLRSLCRASADFADLNLPSNSHANSFQTSLAPRAKSTISASTFRLS